MASDITVRVSAAAHDTTARETAVRALDVFHEVDRTCTRFAPTSDLMLANTAADWQPVRATCFAALVEAHAAYRRTDGRFDPRVLDDLVRLGYDRSFRHGPSERPGAVLTPRAALPVWRPEFRRATQEVSLGPHAVDLGGIGKGLAIRWYAQQLTGTARGFLIDAGGDCYCVGTAPEGGPWRVSVEDPSGGADPVAVLEVRDAAVATSSIRLRHWDVDGTAVHHLLDPSTGLPGGAGLASVTVLADDPAEAEVWSKVLFLAGARGIATMTAHFGVAALWVDEDGRTKWSGELGAGLLWAA